MQWTGAINQGLWWKALLLSFFEEHSMKLSQGAKRPKASCRVPRSLQVMDAIWSAPHLELLPWWVTSWIWWCEGRLGLYHLGKGWALTRGRRPWTASEQWWKSCCNCRSISFRVALSQLVQWWLFSPLSSWGLTFLIWQRLSGLHSRGRWSELLGIGWWNKGSDKPYLQWQSSSTRT